MAYWNRDNRQANLNRNDPENSNSNNGVRGAVRDYVLFRNFIQPPSILPISVSLLCVWKILVSLAIFNSRKSRNFKIDISSIDLSIVNIWQIWFKFRKGKRKTKELEIFSYYLEQNLEALYSDLNADRYKHGEYKKFIVTDSKRREIRVADIRDRVVHRLLYEYLYQIYDKTFIYDVWSCRENKGLLGAIERAQRFISKYPNSFIWRSDIKKFFDNIDQQTLIEVLCLRIKDIKAINILKEVIKSYSLHKGIPIGNLTSQIFANIYLNELDRLLKHTIKPQAYLRYGDDFIIISENLDQLKQDRVKIIKFIKGRLRLEINIKNDIIIKAKWGLKFLGVWIFPRGRKLNKRNWQRAKDKLNHKNISSYSGLVKQHSKEKRIKEFNWLVLEKLNNEL
ncbi:reverse transcriptase/maturase family protein [Patescibacteria group bacterium]